MSDRRTAFDAITKDKPTLAGFPSFPSGHRSTVGRGFSEALLLFLHGGELRRLRE